MPQTLLKHGLVGELWVKKALNLINASQFSKFCCLFTLQQGTIMIAIVELSVTSFCLFLLLLAATHAQDIVDLVTSDLVELEENNLYDGGVEESAAYILNEKKMLLGQHLAVFVMFIIWASLLLAIINFIFCTLLLIGAIRNSPDFLLPWTSTALFSLISGFFFIIILAFVPFRECKLGVFLVLLFFFALELYAWLIVFSYYQELKT